MDIAKLPLPILQPRGIWEPFPLSVWLFIEFEFNLFLLICHFALPPEMWRKLSMFYNSCATPAPEIRSEFRPLLTRQRDPGYIIMAFWVLCALDKISIVEYRPPPSIPPQPFRLCTSCCFTLALPFGIALSFMWY